jgi:orotate phosphoribosyltransferase
MDHSNQEFIEFALKKQVLQFGQFKTKAGRLSPYFFNTGLFNDGESLMKLGMFYAKSIEASKIPFDMLYGPAYKGIPLVASIVIAFASMGRNVPFAFNRKEKKDHGEGGVIIGSPLKGLVLIVDDVISAGTSVNESVKLILEEGAKPSGIAISIDREERGNGLLSAVEEIKNMYHLPVCHLTSLTEILRYMESNKNYKSNLAKMLTYQAQYGHVV